MEQYRHFTLIVAGENPEAIIDRYSNKEVDRHVLFDFSRRDELYDRELRMYTLLSTQDLDDGKKELVREHLNYLKFIDSTEYYLDITEDYELDDNDGNVYTTENPDRKFDQCNIGKNLSVPFTLKNGEYRFQALKSEVDWEGMSSSNRHAYEIAWDTVKGGKVPETDEERTIYENMKNRTAYFDAYGTRDNYILSNTSFWAYAFADEDGWYELSDDVNQFEWVRNFVKKFIDPLSDDTRLTVFECIRN